MATLKKQVITDGFMRATDVGVSVTVGAKATLAVDVKVKAKTESNVYKELLKYKQDFHEDTWQKIEKAHASGEVGFFWELFGISAGGSYDYYNKKTQQNIKNDIQSQRVAQALHDTDETEVEVKGTIEAEGVSINGKEAFTAIASKPDGKAADIDGSQKNVTGSGQLNTITADLYKISREGVIIV